MDHPTESSMVSPPSAASCWLFSFLLTLADCRLLIVGLPTCLKGGQFNLVSEGRSHRSAACVATHLRKVAGLFLGSSRSLFNERSSTTRLLRCSSRSASARTYQIFMRDFCFTIRRQILISDTFQGSLLLRRAYVSFSPQQEEKKKRDRAVWTNVAFAVSQD